jgi:hypothetical protein
MSSQAATAERPGLMADQRGAIMVMGLFMATMLIGAMWYMKGIGDAVVFRDRMQEAADHEVFSSAAVHARGMNLISVINLVMYARRCSAFPRRRSSFASQRGSSSGPSSVSMTRV